MPKDITLEHFKYLLSRLDFFEQKMASGASQKDFGFTQSEKEELQLLYKIMGYLRSLAIAEIAEKTYAEMPVASYIQEKTEQLEQQIKQTNKLIANELIKSGASLNPNGNGPFLNNDLEILRQRLAEETRQLESVKNLTSENFVKYLISTQAGYTKLEEVIRALSRADEYTATSMRQGNDIDPFLDIFGHIKVPTVKLALDCLNGDRSNYERLGQINLLDHEERSLRCELDVNAFTNPEPMPVDNLQNLLRIYSDFQELFLKASQKQSEVADLEREYKSFGILKHFNGEHKEKLESARKNLFSLARLVTGKFEELKSSVNRLVQVCNAIGFANIPDINVGLIDTDIKKVSIKYEIIYRLQKVIYSVTVDDQLIFNKNLDLDLMNATYGLREYVERGVYKKALTAAVEKIAAEKAAIKDQVPVEYLSVDPLDLSRITHYGRGRIGGKEDYMFNKARAVLRTLLIIDEVQKGDKLGHESILDQEKEAAIRLQAEKLINDTINNGNYDFAQSEPEQVPTNGI